MFTAGAWQLKWVSDDGYIYLSYVQNLVDLDNGAVFNVGERVEAFTSPLWFALLSVVAFIVPRSIAELPDLAMLVGFGISVISVGLWIPIERAARRPRDNADRRAILNLPLAIVAGVYVFRSFATSGLETSLLLLWLGLTVFAVFARQPRRWAFAALAGVAPLVRPDLGLVAVGLMAVLAVLCRRDRPSRRQVAGLFSLVAVPLLITSIARVLYYAQLAPNTYYAKTDTGHGVSDGLNYLADVTSVYGLPWFLIVVVGALLAGMPSIAGADRTEPDAAEAGDRASLEEAEAFDRWRTERRVVLLGLAGLSGCYVIWIGGDFMHGRFWITPWVLLLGAAAGVGSDAVAAFASRASIAPRAVAGLAAAGAIAVTSMHLTLEPAQSRMVEVGSGFIDGIADEGAFYASQNPNLHRLGAQNLSRQYELGEVVAQLAAAVGEEIGIAQGAIGQVAFAGQKAGDVYVFDMAGLTRTAGSRVEPLPNGRVGHAKVAPDVLVATNDRVDLWLEAVAPAWLPPEADFEYAGFTWRLGNLSLLGRLVEVGIVEQSQADALQEAYADALVGPAVDADLVTYLTLRASDDAPYQDRLRELSSLGQSSSWAQWERETEIDRAMLGTGGCPSRNPFVCLRRSINRHGVGEIPSPDLAGQPALTSDD